MLATMDEMVDDRFDRWKDRIHPEEIEKLMNLLGAIDELEGKILRLRYGIGGEGPYTLKVIGEQVGLTRERVRQIEVQALRKLKARIDASESGTKRL
jgi:RNA polymerase primary sigma factor